MNTISKAISVNVQGLSRYASYTYEVSVYDFVAADFVPIYIGRCFSDADGRAKLLVEGILRDHAYKFPVFWSETEQAMRPAFSTFGAQSMPVEQGGDFYCTMFSVAVYDGSTPVAFRFENVWAGFSAPWQDGELMLAEPMAVNLAALGIGVLPHLPSVATTQYWFSLAMVLRFDGAFTPAGYTLSLGDKSAVMKLSGEGTHTTTWTLNTMLTGMEDNIIDGGNSASVPDDIIDGGDSASIPDEILDGGNSETQTTIAGGTLSLTIGDITMPVAEFDVCPSPYYVAWRLPSGGWMSWGFDGNVLYNADTKVVERQTLLDTDEVVTMDSQPRFTVHSGFLTREQYNMLCTLRYARKVYVYDVKRDKGTWCSVDNRQGDTAGEVRWRNQPFVAVLKGNQHWAI